MSSIKLSITEPCHENWNAMLPDEKGRFCLSCQKTVVDFTAMNDREVFEYFKNYQGNTCGQFNNDQLDRELAKPKTHSIGRWRYFWQMLLPAFFAFQKLEAQPKLRGKVAATPVCRPMPEKPVTIRMGMVAAPQQLRKTNYQIAGQLLNDEKEPIAFATITSSDGKYAVADSTGRFKMTLNDQASLTISQIGYIERTFTIDSLQTNNITGLTLENGGVIIQTTIKLEHQEVKTPNVTIIAGALQGRLGDITMIRYRTLSSEPKTISPNSSLPQLKIFPNPIRPGQNFQITFQVQKTGSYVLQIADAAGHIVLEENLVLVSNNKTESINGEALQQAGIYFLKLINPANRKSKPLNGRIVVQ